MSAARNSHERAPGFVAAALRSTLSCASHASTSPGSRQFMDGACSLWPYFQVAFIRTRSLPRPPDASSGTHRSTVVFGGP